MPSLASSIAASGAAGPNSPPSSAAVLEFVCLFTHDLRRKQKRWQDGRLKYHTFNKRVMVHDERGNYVGDMHWRRDYEFDEGEEIELERGGVIVQVAECVEKREQDLSELLDKRVKEKEERQAKAAARSNAPLSARPTPRPQQQDHFQSKHRPLHQLIGTPTGHHGRALAPTESPYEQRHSPNNPSEEQDSRAAKRRKYNDIPSKSGYAQALFGASLTLSATPMSSAPVRPRPVPARSPSVELESREHSQEQVALREQPKSSRHFNSQEKRKTMKEPAPVKRSEINKIRPSPALVEDVDVVVEQRDARKRKAAPPQQDRGRQEVVLVEDEDDDNAGSAVLTEASRKRSEPLKRMGEEVTPIPIEKSRKARSRPDIEIADSESGSSRPGQPKSTPKSKAVNRTESLSNRAAPPSRADTGRKAVDGDATAKKQLDHQQQRPEEARTELRIKPRKKRGLLMMTELVTTTPREPVKNSRPERSEGPKKQVEEDKADEDDPLASSPPRPDPQTSRGGDRQSREVSPVLDATIDDGGSALHDNTFGQDPEEDDDNTLRSVIGTKSKTSKRPKSRRKIILVDDDDEEEEEADEERPMRPPEKRRAQAAAKSIDIYDIETADSEDVEIPKKQLRKPTKSKKSPVTEEADARDSAVDDGNVTPRRNLKRITAQRRRLSRDPTPAESAADSNFAESDDAQERPRKRRRSDDHSKVPPGPRLARLSKKSIKSREVIGFVLEDAAMFRGLGTTTRPSVPQLEQQEASEERTAVTAPLTSAKKRSEHVMAQEPVITTPQQPEPLLVPEPRVIDPVEEIKLPAKQGPANIDPPCVLEEIIKPSGAHEARSREKGTITTNLDRARGQDTIVSDAPSPPPAEDLNGAAALEIDLLEGVTLSPVVFSPAKPSVSTTVPDQGLPIPDDTVIADPKETPSVKREAGNVPPITEKAPSPPPLERRTVNGLGRQTSVIGSLQRINSAEARAPEPAEDTTSTTKPTPAARIVNPATRGRKAALKSHAAGKVPQPVLPANPVQYGAPTVIYIEKRPGPAEAEQQPPPARQTTTVKKMSFPGFAPARQSGPWSREAFDLLERGRPL